MVKNIEKNIEREEFIMNKKLLAVFTSIILIMAMLAAVCTAADSPIKATHGLAGLEAVEGGLVKSDTGTVNMGQDKSLKIQTQNATYGLNGDPSDSSKYDANRFNARRTKLATFKDGTVLPAGTYTISVYVYKSATFLGNDLDHYSKIAFSLHGTDETDATVANKHMNCQLITLFNATKGTAVDNSNAKFAPSGVEEKVGTRTWVEYTATVTTTKAVNQFAFWLIGDETHGDSSTIATYIDELSVYNEAAKPAESSSETSSSATESSTTSNTTASNTTSATTADSTTSAATTSDATSDTTEENKNGCGASFGSAGILIGAVSAISVAVVSKKKRK